MDFIKRGRVAGGGGIGPSIQLRNRVVLSQEDRIYKKGYA